MKKPFLVIATQNPVDHEGTFPLPEAQLDRFLMKFSVGYPSTEDELTILDRFQLAYPIDSLKPVVKAAEIVACQQQVRQIHVDSEILKYTLQIVHLTRHHEHLCLGGSPRASIALFRTCQTLAAIPGSKFVLLDDVKMIAVQF